jgi:hypothetical protein
MSTAGVIGKQVMEWQFSIESEGKRVGIKKIGA